ncbi:MAG TPA: hypothetical protein VJU77_11370 [Chthoniobacterales bacterium]|nr:hypothetical protein [Chthoniobacterales bacterium]
MEGIPRVRRRLGDDAVSALMTSTVESLEQPEAIIDEYVDLGFRSSPPDSPTSQAAGFFLLRVFPAGEQQYQNIPSLTLPSRFRKQHQTTWINS